MTIALIVRVTIHPGKGAEFEAAFAEQATGVRASEPGNRLYQLVRSREDETAYVVMELYDDKAALEAHRNAPHMAAVRPRIAPLIAARSIVEAYDAV